MNLENAILETVVSQIQDNPKIEKVLLEKLEKAWISPKTVTLRIPKLHRKAIELTDQHFKFEAIFKAASARVNIALVWPAWSWKTTIVSNVAKALQIPFYSQSVSAQTGVHEFFGYNSATWKYIPTLFRQAYEKWWVFLVDEFDAGNPNVLASLNQATANWHCAFPDWMVKKHENFIVVMAWNTYGTWPNAEYVGRNKIDAATLDRFAFIELPYDETMELASARNKDWAKHVQELRKKAQEKWVRVIISPRATFMGEDLLEAWLSVKEVKEMLIYKSLSKDEINLIDLIYRVPSKKTTEIDF